LGVFPILGGGIVDVGHVVNGHDEAAGAYAQRPLEEMLVLLL
jgi:hypothetical protein